MRNDDEDVASELHGARGSAGLPGRHAGAYPQGRAPRDRGRDARSDSRLVQVQLPGHRPRLWPGVRAPRHAVDRTGGEGAARAVRRLRHGDHSQSADSRDPRAHRHAGRRLRGSELPSRLHARPPLRPPDVHRPDDSAVARADRGVWACESLRRDRAGRLHLPGRAAGIPRSWAPHRTLRGECARPDPPGRRCHRARRDAAEPAAGCQRSVACRRCADRRRPGSHPENGGMPGGPAAQRRAEAEPPRLDERGAATGPGRGTAGLLRRRSTAGQVKEVAMSLPRKIVIHELGPREGMQIEKNPVSTAEKIRLIDLLSECHFPEIEVVSFVNPKWVPQMADAEQVVAGFKRAPGTKYTSVYLNTQGMNRAVATKKLDVEGSLSVTASETFSKQNPNP